MSFLDKMSKAVQVKSEELAVTTMDKVTLANKHGISITLTLYHGTKDFIGDKFSLNHVGSASTDRANDQYGTGVYMSDQVSTAEIYSGTSGVVITSEVEFVPNSISNLCDPVDYRNLIEESILNSEWAFDYFNTSHETNDNVPFYDVESESYECRNSGEEVEMELKEFIIKFGGLRKIFTSDYYRAVNNRTIKNPVDDLIETAMRCENLYESLLIIESDLYSPNLRDVTERVKAAEPLNNLREKYGVTSSLVDFNDNGVSIVLHSTSSITIKDILQKTPKIQESMKP